jgi:hypothetical protein
MQPEGADGSGALWDVAREWSRGCGALWCCCSWSVAQENEEKTKEGRGDAHACSAAQVARSMVASHLGRLLDCDTPSTSPTIFWLEKARFQLLVLDEIQSCQTRIPWFKLPDETRIILPSPPGPCHTTVAVVEGCQQPSRGLHAAIAGARRMRGSSRLVCARSRSLTPGPLLIVVDLK